MKKIRIDKLLSNSGKGSRSEIKKIIKQGKVKINGIVCKDSSTIIDLDFDAVELDNEKIIYIDKLYIMLNKPSGVVSATTDNIHKTVIDLIPNEIKIPNLFPVGRLDIDTEGLLIITNDGEMGHNLTSPKKHIPKTYYVEVDSELKNKHIEIFNDGILLDCGYKTLPAKLEILESGSKSACLVTIHEGKFHQIKRMFAEIKMKVVFLKRIKMGNLELDKSLSSGSCRLLTKEELELLRNK